MNEDFILKIIEKFDSGSAGELDLNSGSFHLTLKKTRPVRDISGYLHETQQSGTQSSGTQQSGTQPDEKFTNTPANEKITNTAADETKITSPIVATFYSAPGPDAPPFVKAGSRVKAGQTLCILEAMKMMNHLQAEYDCEITEVHAANGDFIEYGQVLFTARKLKEDL